MPRAATRLRSPFAARRPARPTMDRLRSAAASFQAGHAAVRRHLFRARRAPAFVRVDGQIFTHSVAVADASVKGAKPNDKVVFEMIRFPDLGGWIAAKGSMIVEVIGRAGDPKVDTTAKVVRAPGHSGQVLRRSPRRSARASGPPGSATTIFTDREDFTGQLVVTIDPVDAKDFDDAVSLTKDVDTGHWQLTVHICGRGHFIPPGGPIDRECRATGAPASTSPQPRHSRWSRRSSPTDWPACRRTRSATSRRSKWSLARTANRSRHKSPMESSATASGSLTSKSRRFSIIRTAKRQKGIAPGNRPHAARHADTRQGDARSAQPAAARSKCRCRSRRAGRYDEKRARQRRLHFAGGAGREPPAHRRLHAGRERSGREPLRSTENAVVPTPHSSGPRTRASWRLLRPSHGRSILTLPGESRAASTYSVCWVRARKTTGERYAVHYAMLRSLKQATYSPGAR